MARFERVIAPVDLPLSDIEARLHLRDPENTEDSEILSFIRSAVETVEHKTGRAFVTQTWEAYFDRFPAGCYRSAWQYLELSPVPVQSVLSITYTDGAGIAQTLATTEYVLAKGDHSARIRLAAGKSWPAANYGYPEAITVRYVAGYADVDDIPENILHWIKLFIETADKQRGLGSDKPFVMSPFADGLLDGSKTGLGV